jgi:predicted dehydrogenase
METMNRRTFLEKSGLVVAGAAAGLTVLRASPSGASQNDTIGAAVVGFHGRGSAHISELMNIPGVQIVALCDVDESLWEAAAKRVEEKQGKRPKLYADVRKMLEDKDVNVVATATPNHWHALITIWSCQAGKDVYVEKPACWGFHEGEKMIEAARKYNRIVQVGHQSRSSNGVRNAVARAWAGEIGEIYMARGMCFKPRGSIGIKPDSAPPPHLHWDLWQGPAARRPFNPNFVHYNWHWFWEYGNGDIGNQGVHQMDIARWFLAKRLPVRVHSSGGRYGYKDQGETPNTQVATFHFDDGKMLVFEVRGLPSNDELGDRIGNVVYGAEGYLGSGDGFKPHIGYRGDGQVKEISQLPQVGGAGDGNHFVNFINAVRSRKREDLNCEVEEGVLSAQLCHLANISYRLRRALVFDPMKKRFVGDAEANDMLRRKRSAKGFEIPEKV